MDLHGKMNLDDVEIEVSGRTDYTGSSCELSLALKNIKPWALASLPSVVMIGQGRAIVSVEASHPLGILYDPGTKITVAIAGDGNVEGLYRAAQEVLRHGVSPHIESASIGSDQFNASKVLANMPLLQEKNRSSLENLVFSYPMLNRDMREKIFLPLADGRGFEIYEYGPIDGARSASADTMIYLARLFGYNQALIHYPSMISEMSSYFLRAEMIHLPAGKLTEALADIERAQAIGSFILENNLRGKPFDEIHDIDTQMEYGPLWRYFDIYPEAVSRKEMVLAKTLRQEIMKAEIRSILARKAGREQDIPSYVALARAGVSRIIEEFYKPGRQTFTTVPNMDSELREPGLVQQYAPTEDSILAQNENSKNNLRLEIYRQIVVYARNRLSRISADIREISEVSPRLPGLSLAEQIYLLEKNELERAVKNMDWGRAASLSGTIRELEEQQRYKMANDPLSFGGDYAGSLLRKMPH